MLITCSHCGAQKPETEFHKDKTKKNGRRSRCKVCHAARVKANRDNWGETKKEQNRHYMAKNKFQWNKKLKDHFGGKCEKCGYDKCYAALEFHHKDPSTKEGMLGSMWISSNTWDQALEEAKKCALLCSNCHKEEHHLARERLLLD